MHPKASIALMKFLSSAAKQLGVAAHVYAVGGAPRNFLLGLPIKDVDLVVDSLALNGKDSEWFARQLQKVIPARTMLTTNNYGVAIISVTESWLLEGHDLGGETIEIANARKESYGEGGYKPEKVEPASMQQDALRRELTFNTLMWRLLDLTHGPDRKSVIDIMGCGIKDLEEGVMRCPRDPDIVLKDDPSRMLRIIRFSLRFGFRIPPDLEASIRRNAQRLKQIPSAHISNMLIETFLREPTGKKALLEMKRLGLLDVIKEIAIKDKPFQAALAGWAESEAKIQFLFDLMDLGMPVGKKLGFLTESQKERVREITIDMDPVVAEAFVAALKQPGKVMDSPAIIQDFGLVGKDIAVLSEIARDKLLITPELAQDRSGLTEVVRQSLTLTRRVASQYIKRLARGR